MSDIEKYIDLETGVITSEKKKGNIFFPEITSEDDIETFLEENEIKSENTELLKEKLSENLREKTGDDDLDFSISYQVINRSFGELIGMMKEEDIIYPDFQRKFVWDKSKSSKLIDSILIGLPIPSIFLLRKNEEKYEVIDGQQRLLTIHKFVTGEPWRDEKIVSKLKKGVSTKFFGKSFSELESKDQKKILRTSIPVIEFTQQSPGNDRSKYILFERINSGAVTLTNMQIRKTVAYGKFMQDIYDISELPQFSDLKNLISKNKQLEDGFEELIVRGICLNYLINKKISHQKSAKLLLDNTCSIFCDEDIKEEIIKTLEEMKSINDQLENKFCRTLKEDKKQYKSQITLTIFETIFATIFLNPNSIGKFNQKQYLELIESISEKDVTNSFKYATNNENNMLNRFERMKDCYD